MDYLKVTVWTAPEEAMQLLERGLLDRYGWSDGMSGTREEWDVKEAKGRALAVYSSGDVAVVEYKDEIQREGEFCSIELKGQACDRIGNEGIRLLLQDVDRAFRWRASRVDVMAHTEFFTPAAVRDAVRRGDVCSRSVTSDDCIWLDSVEGDTCYLGYVPKPAGGMKRKGERSMRIYDRRGPTRVELELRGECAEGAGLRLCSLPIEDWPVQIRGMMRHYVDLVDRSADPRPTRCPPLAWWLEFMESVEKMSVRMGSDDCEAKSIGKVDGTLQRYCRWLQAAVDAYGADWLAKRIKRHWTQRVGGDHEERVEALKAWLGSGIADVPEGPELPPI